MTQRVEAAVDGMIEDATLESISREGESRVEIMLAPDVDPSAAIRDIRSAIDQIPSFPALAETPFEFGSRGRLSFAGGLPHCTCWVVNQ